MPSADAIFLFIPTGRASSAYGYAQVKDELGRLPAETGSGWSDRDDFADAIDFMGWYTQQRRSGSMAPPNWDAYGQYLNYHEGWGGYRRGSYRSKGG